jgi:hypothetical protein
LGVFAGIIRFSETCDVRLHVRHPRPTMAPGKLEGDSKRASSLGAF